jgi:hypothetical protein
MADGLRLFGILRRDSDAGSEPAHHSGRHVKVVELATYVVFCFFCLRHYAPKMKRIEFDETRDGRYTSVWASRIAIFIGASVGTILCIPFIDKIKFLKDLPH